MSANREATSFLFSAALASATVWLGIHAHDHWWAPLPLGIGGFDSWSAWRFKLFASGPIPHAILWCFVFGMLYLIEIWRKKFVPLALSNHADATVLAAVRSGKAEELVAALNAQAPRGVGNPARRPARGEASNLRFLFGAGAAVPVEFTGYFSERLRRMRKRYEEDYDLPAVQAMKDDILANDEEDIVLSFNAVSWTEWALPMLGFLGTVVGIGGAVGGIREAIGTLFSGVETPERRAIALTKFNEAFVGLGVAFDTTFLGLIFLLILALLKMSLKKMIGARLTEARNVLFDAVSMWQASDPSKRVVAAIGGLQMRIQALEERVEERDARATAFRERLQSAALNVVRKHPALTEMKNILFRPIVEFSENVLPDDGENFLGKRKIKSIVPSLISGTEVAVFAAPDDATGDVIRFTIGPEILPAHTVATEQRITRLCAFEPHSGIIAKSGHRVLLVKEGNQPTELACKFHGQLFPIVYGEESDVVIWVRELKGSTLISVRRFSEMQADEDALDQSFQWICFAAQQFGGTLFVAGTRREGGGSVLERWEIENSASTLRLQKRGRQSLMTLNSMGLRPYKVEALSRTEAVILDDAGGLHYWDKEAHDAVVLRNADWRVNAGNYAGTMIRAGAGGWVAIATPDRLQMWQIARGGVLNPYEVDGQLLEFDVRGVKRESYTSTIDGRVLLAADVNGRLVGWKFPWLQVDGM